MKTLKTPKETVEQIREDMLMEGLHNYEACYHSELYIDEFAKMSAKEITKYMLTMIKMDKYMDAWIATVLDTLWEKKEEYKLPNKWFDEIAKEKKLPEW